MAVATRILVLSLALAVLTVLTTVGARAGPIDRVLERLDRLEEENRLLREELEALKAERIDHAARPPRNIRTG